MLNLNPYFQAAPSNHNIQIQLVDEKGNYVDPTHLKEVEYLSRFQNKAVVNKVVNQMVAAQRTGTILVYQDKIEVKEN